MSARRSARAGILAATALLAAGLVPAASGQTAPNPVTSPPQLGSVKPLTVPAVVERRLSNGLRVLVVEQHELPLVDVVLMVRTGSEADPSRKAGLGTLVASMLDEGTSGRSALQIAEQIGFLGIALGSGGGWDASRVSLHTPVAQLDSALALMADVALRPSFPQNELDRLKSERLTSLLQLKDRGPAIAEMAYSHILFGEEHPYGRPQLGDETSVASLTRADVQAFYDSYFRPNNATVIVAGDVTVDDVQRRLERVLGGWRAGTVPTTRFPSPPSPGGPTIYLIDKPGAAQSSVRIGSVAVARSTTDYFALTVLNTVLGGAFTSRLNQNLRETKGYTYGAFSSFDMRRHPGPFTASAEIVTEKTDSALIEFMSELRGIRAPLPAAEVDKAKSYVQLRLPSEFETTGGIAARVASVALHDLPLDYYSRFSASVAGVTPADVQRVAGTYVRPDALAIVVVGDLGRIEPAIRALGIGTVVRRDLTGRPIVP